MPHAPSASTIHHRSARRAVLTLLVTALVAATPVSAAQPAGDADPAVITDWNGVAAQVIPPNPAAFLNYAFVHLAMYNAVVGITGEYELYEWDVYGPSKASPEAAAAVAAHRILMAYFGANPAVASTLDGQLAASLDAVPDGVRKDQGIKYGLRAADRILELRTGDGRFAAVTVPTADAAGEWSPTSAAGFAVPWLGGVKPLVLDSLSQFDPGAPPAIGTDLYRQELAEVRDYGASDSAVRSVEQAKMARYFADLPFRPMEAGLREFAGRHPLDISDSARLFAATNTTIADALGTVWNSKLRYMWWRPIHAIHETHDDGDSLTVRDTAWAPLITTPPYPEWPSGLCAVIAALTGSLEEVTGEVDLNLESPSQGPEHWSSKAVLDQSAVDARVWSGIHFRTADEISIDIGSDVASYVLDRQFRPAARPAD